jgi:hypothetical protein
MRMAVVLMAWIFKTASMASGAGPYTLVYLHSWIHMNESTDVYLELHVGVWKVRVNRDWIASPY